MKTYSRELCDMRDRRRFRRWRRRAKTQGVSMFHYCVRQIQKIKG